MREPSSVLLSAHLLYYLSWLLVVWWEEQHSIAHQSRHEDGDQNFVPISRLCPGILDHHMQAGRWGVQACLAFL
jgi:hypothetical protein